MRIALAASILVVLPSLAAAGSPALVTMAKGDVSLVEDGQRTPLPGTPFVLGEGQTLHLDDGAMVVVLHQGVANRTIGPADVAVAGLARPDPGADGTAVGMLDELLARNATTRRAGASRATASLRRPVPRTSVLELSTIAWTCEAPCTASQVAIENLHSGDIVWKSTGSGTVAYDGPTLEPGAYYLNLGVDVYQFTVADQADRDQVQGARKAAAAAERDLAAHGADAAAIASIGAGVYLQAGFPTDALYIVDAAVAAHPDDAGLQSLRSAYERRAGLVP